jgi:hypothetical protein
LYEKTKQTMPIANNKKACPLVSPIKKIPEDRLTNATRKKTRK